MRPHDWAVHVWAGHFARHVHNMLAQEILRTTGQATLGSAECRLHQRQERPGCHIRYPVEGAEAVELALPHQAPAASKDLNRVQITLVFARFLLHMPALWTACAVVKYGIPRRFAEHFAMYPCCKVLD